MTDKVKEKKHERKSKTNTWLVVGVIVLIVLLLLWLTIADFLGDTDVAAYITSPFMHI